MILHAEIKICSIDTTPNKYEWNFTLCSFQIKICMIDSILIRLLRLNQKVIGYKDKKK